MIYLPPLIILFGPAGVGKTTLADLLSNRIPNTLTMSIRQPLWDGLRGVFFDGNPTLPLGEDTELPFTNEPASAWLSDFEKFIGQDTLSNLLLDRTQAEMAYWSSIVIDDASEEYIAIVKRLILYHRPENCCLVCMSRGDTVAPPPSSGSGVRIIELPNHDSDPKGLVDSFLLLFDVPPAAHSEGAAL